MSDNLNKFKAILREMFQFDQADLDFGIYRIMNSKRDEIETFLDKDLLPQVKSAFETFQGDDQSAVREQLEKLRKNLEEASVDPESSPKYHELKQQLAGAVDVVALENEVFSQLTNFFRRYYQGGDFLSLRRYKEGVYAIPYEGEEVKLHWANADQYYIKSSEDFRDYAFTLASGKKVHFKLVEASTEQNNKKEQAGKERRFVLCEEAPVLEQNGELFIRFEYRVVEGKTKQTALNDAAVETVMAMVEGEWRRGLTTPAPTAKNPKRTLLQKHLGDYTAKYSFDYFIHKDLGGFLRRELDFFIKNEVLFIDDLDTEHIKSSISKAKVIKQIGHKVIAILEQLENFQKKLWLKKKFVVETGYCVTLDRVPEELYPEIVANQAQIEEWKRLFAIQEIEGDLHTPSYSEPLTIDFLKANPFLVIDTAFFDHILSDKLLSTFDNLEELTAGLLLHGDNYQALNLLQERFSSQVECTYIDPPYNTGVDEFIYKDGYKSSSWLSMLASRCLVAWKLVSPNGIFLASIDDNEMHRLRLMLESLLVGNQFISNIAWKSRQHLDSRAKTRLSNDHEYILSFGRSALSAFRGAEKDMDKYSNPDNDPRGPWMSRSMLGLATADQRPNLHYELVDPATGKSYPCPAHTGWRYSTTTMLQKIEENKILFPKKDDGRPREKVFLSDLQDDFTGFSSVITDVFTANGSEEIRNLFGVQVIQFPKPTELVRRLVEQGTTLSSQVIDFYAGSGTTGHAVINQNRLDGGTRKYILLEMGNHFNTALKPRLEKVIYSKDWQNGKPVSREGSSHMFKYIRLESYEDALNNLQLKRTQSQQELLDQNDPLREQYMLSYMLDVESAGSASLLNVDAFTNPFNYRMNIARGNETKETVVDLVETFNWLLGIKVLRLSAREYRTADFARDAEGRLQIKDRPRSCAAGEGWTFKEVEGETLAGDKVLIIWRTLTDNPEQDNLMLDAWFSKRNYSTLDFEFSRIYVNGDNNLENLKIGEERWKVALIEEEFKRLMFSVEG